MDGGEGGHSPLPPTSIICFQYVDEEEEGGGGKIEGSKGGRKN